MGVLRPSWPHLGQIIGQGGLEIVKGRVSSHRHGAQVRDVKDHGVFPTGLVFSHGPFAIGERHLPATELDELGAEGLVEVVEGGSFQGVAHAAFTSDTERRCRSASAT